ncbi:hypothetical protein ACFLUZ_07235 [Chloroflexota bacterium]
MAGVEIQWLGYILIALAILGAIYFVYSLKKGKQLSQEQADQTNLIVEHPQGTTSNILHIERQEPTNRPPFWVVSIVVIAAIIFLAFGGVQTYLVLSGIIIAKFNLEWIAFYLLFGVFPIWLLIDSLIFDRKYYKLGKSATAIDVTFIVSEDITDVFNKCSNILETMKAKIIRKNTPNLIKGSLNKSNISIEVSPSDDNVKVYVISDATWVTVKVGKERNQRIIDEFQKHFIDAFRVSKPDNIEGVQPIEKAKDNYADTVNTQSQPSLLLAITNHSFGYRTNTGTYYQNEPSLAFQLVLELIVMLKVWPTMAVEMLELEIAGHRFSPDKWVSEEITGQVNKSVLFVIPRSVNGGQHSIRLFAFASNQWWHSAEYTLALTSNAWWR